MRLSSFSPYTNMNDFSILKSFKIEEANFVEGASVDSPSTMNNDSSLILRNSHIK